MSKKISIKVTEAQPLPCPYCNGFYGYQYSDLFRMSYTSVHNSDGTYSGGEYSDGVSLNKSKTAYCVNCGTKLPFTLIREGEEEGSSGTYKIFSSFRPMESPAFVDAVDRKYNLAEIKNLSGGKGYFLVHLNREQQETIQEDLNAILCDSVPCLL